MKGFIILALQCVFFVAVQGGHRSHHSAEGPVYDALTSVLKDLKQHAEIISEDLTQKLNQTFHDIKEKVDHLRDNNPYGRGLEGLKGQSETAEKCFKDHEMVIAQFMRSLVNTYESCSKEVKQQLKESIGTIQNYATTVKDAPKHVDEISAECLNVENGTLAASILCVVTRIAEVQEDIFEASHSVEDFVNHGLEEVEDFTSNKCEGMDNLKKEFDVVYGKIATCANKQ